MKVFLIAAFLILPSSHCYVISDDGDTDATPKPISREKDPSDMNRLIEDVSKVVFGDDTELMKEITEEIDEEMSDSSREVLEGMKKNFLASMMRLHEGGQLYKDARREAILSALSTAFKETTDDEDPAFIADLNRRLQQREQQKRQKIKEFETNGLKEQASDQSLKSKK